MKDVVSIFGFCNHFVPFPLRLGRRYGNNFDHIISETIGRLGVVSRRLKVRVVCFIPSFVKLLI